MLTAPLTWLLVVYVGSLSLLVVSAFFRLDSFTGKSTSEWTLSNITEVTTKSAYLKLVAKSVGVATAATLVCLAAAIPTAFYVSKCAAQWAKRGLIVAMLLPLWAGYLVKAYALRAVFDPGSEFGSGGFLSSTVGWSPGFGYIAVILTLAYLWFPYMLLPIYAGFERLSDSLLDASAFVGTLEKRQGLRIAVPEEIAWRNGWLDDSGLQAAGEALGKSAYGTYLLGLLCGGTQP